MVAKKPTSPNRTPRKRKGVLAQLTDVASYILKSPINLVSSVFRPAPPAEKAISPVRALTISPKRSPDVEPAKPQRAKKGARMARPKQANLQPETVTTTDAEEPNAPETAPIVAAIKPVKSKTPRILKPKGGVKKASATGKAAKAVKASKAVKPAKLAKAAKPAKAVKAVKKEKPAKEAKAPRKPKATKAKAEAVADEKPKQRRKRQVSEPVDEPGPEPKLAKTVKALKVTGGVKKTPAKRGPKPNKDKQSTLTEHAANVVVKAAGGSVPEIKRAPGRPRTKKPGNIHGEGANAVKSPLKKATRKRTGIK